MEMQQTFGKRLEQLLLEKGISQGEFAEAVNCSRQYLSTKEFYTVRIYFLKCL